MPEHWAVLVNRGGEIKPAWRSENSTELLKCSSDGGCSSNPLTQAFPMTQNPKPRRIFENALAPFWANFRFQELSDELRPAMKTRPNAPRLYATEQKARTATQNCLFPPFW